jgi:hypothetical protein
MRYSGKYFGFLDKLTLGASVKDDKTDNEQTNKLTIKQHIKRHRFVKSKELQAYKRSIAFAANLILPNSNQVPTTTRAEYGLQFRGTIGDKNVFKT